MAPHALQRRPSSCRSFLNVHVMIQGGRSPTWHLSPQPDQEEAFVPQVILASVAVQDPALLSPVLALELACIASLQHLKRELLVQHTHKYMCPDQGLGSGDRAAATSPLRPTEDEDLREYQHDINRRARGCTSNPKRQNSNSCIFCRMPTAC